MMLADTTLASAMSKERFEYQAVSVKEEIPEDGLLGMCTVCERFGRFTQWGTSLRESGFCRYCGSFNRQRQMAAGIRDVLGVKTYESINLDPNLSIFNTESNGALHRRLESAVKRYTCSEFFGPDVAPGSLVNGVMHQDLQDLTFADDNFDIVLSSDVLEHMPHPYTAHAEIFRVLKPGGTHVFTVPFNPLLAKDDIRAVLTAEGIEYLAPKAFHGDPVRPNEGVLVWTIFGREMMYKLEKIGFEMNFRNYHKPLEGIIGPWSIVFFARKPSGL